jgi:ribose transport system permease protein
MTTSAKRRLRKLLTLPAVRALLPLLTVLLVGCVFHQQGAFFEWHTHRDMLREISVIGILACGMTVVIITAGIDLSVGSVLALCAVSFALLTMPLGLAGSGAIVAVLALGALVGAVNGVLVAFARMQAFIVTLATMVFARGLAKYLSGGKKVTNYVVGSDSMATTLGHPEIFSRIDSKVLGDNISIVTLVFLVCALLTWILLARLRLGRYLYAVGGNLEAARLSGVPVRATLVSAYLLCGLFCAAAGVCQAAQETHGDPETGLGYELDAIAMVVLGGTSLMGGRGSVGLTLVGALTLGYLQKVLSLNAFSTEARLMLTGVIIVAAVLFQRRSVAR